MIYEATVEGRTLRVEVRRKDGRYTVILDGTPMEVDLVETSRSFLSLLVDGVSHEVGVERRDGAFTVVLPDDILEVALVEAARGTTGPLRKAASGPARVTAPMPGRLVRVLVQAGDEVVAGQGLIVMEAMKMENEIRSPRSGRVKEVPVRERQAVETGALLVLVE